MSWPMAAAALGGSALGFLGQKSSNDASLEAAEIANTPRVWDPADPYARGALSEAGRLYDMQGFAPGPTQPELLGRQTQWDYANNQLPGLINQTQQSWQQGLNQGLNPYVTQMIQAGQNDLVQNFQRNVMPTLASRAVGNGGYGGGRQGVAQGLAAEGLMESMGDLSSGMLNNAFNQSQQQQQAAWNAAPNMLAFGFMPGEAQSQIGNQYRQDLALPGQNLMQYANTIMPWATPSTGGAVPQLGSTFGSMLGGASAGAGLYDAFTKNNTPATPAATA